MNNQNVFTMRNGDAQALVAMLEKQQSAKLDLIVPNKFMRATGPRELTIAGAFGNQFADAGLSAQSDTFKMLPYAEAQMCDKLGIPRQYFTRMAAQVPEFDELDMGAMLFAWVMEIKSRNNTKS